MSDMPILGNRGSGNGEMRGLYPILVGSLLGTFITLSATIGVEFSRNHLFIIPAMANNLSIEIELNQEHLKAQIAPLNDGIRDVSNSVPYVSAPPSGSLISDIYHSYLNQIDLLDEPIKSDLLIHYENIIKLNYQQKFVENTLSQYSASPQLASKGNALDALKELLKQYENALMNGDILEAEIINRYHVEILPADQTKLDLVQQRTAEYLKNNTTSIVISLGDIKSSVGADGILTSLALFELGVKPKHPLNGEFKR